MKKLTVIPFLLLAITVTATGQTPSLRIDSEWTLPLSADPHRPFSEGQTGARAVVGPVDLDRDGKPEIFLSDYTGGGRAHMLELDAGGWGHVASTPWLDDLASLNNARAIAVGDLDGDGWGEVVIPTGFGFDAGSPYPPGLFVFEMTGDNTFASGPTFVYDFQPDPPTRWRVEQITIRDVDGDGRQEIVFANNDSNNAQDNWRVLSVSGDLGSGSEAFVEEVRLSSRSTEAFDPVNRGGGSPVGAIPADLDGDGHLEIALQSWNNFNFTNIAALGPDTYDIPGAGDLNVFLQAAASDQVALVGCRAYDLNGDGDDEVLCPSFQTGHVSVLNYEAGESPLQVTSGNVAFEVIPGLSDFDLLILDADGDGNPDLFGQGNVYRATDWASGTAPTWITVSSFMGGDVEHGSNYAPVTRPSFASAGQFRFQTVRYPGGGVGYEDGAQGPEFVSKFTSLGDIDGDGKQEFAASFQGVEDYLNVYDDDGAGNRTLVSSDPNPHRTFVRIFEAGAAPPASRPEDFLLFVEGVNVAVPRFSGATALDPDNAANKVARFAYSDWSQNGFYWDDAVGADLSGYIGDGVFNGGSLFVRLRVDPSLQGRDPLVISFFDTQSGAQGPRADLEAGTATGDLEFRARWAVPEAYRDGQWHDLEIPLPPPTQAALNAAYSSGATLDDHARRWSYGGAWAGGFGVWDPSDPLWREFNWGRVRALGVHYDFADGGGGEVLLDDVYIGAPGADLSVATAPASPVSGVSVSDSGNHNRVDWTAGPDHAGFRLYVMDRAFGQTEIENGEALFVREYGPDQTGDWHRYEVPHPSLIPMELHYAVTSLSQFRVENTATSSVSHANGNLDIQGQVVEIDSNGDGVLGSNLAAGTATKEGFPETAPGFVIDYDGGRWRWSGGSNPQNNADLSGQAWVGFSREMASLYIYAEVTDDQVSRVPNSGCAGCDAWAYDSIEFGWGSYDVRSAPGGSLLGPGHTSFMRGAAPDYQIRLSWLDDGSSSSLVTTAGPSPASAEIAGAQTVFEPLLDQGGQPVGYKVLSRLPFSGIPIDGSDVVFTPPPPGELSYVPFNFQLNDRDGSGTRDHALQWSVKPNATGDWFRDPSQWAAVAVAAAPPPPPTAEVEFQVDVTPLELLGLFDPARDDVQVRGSFNGWGCSDAARCLMTPRGEGAYGLSIPFSEYPGTSFQYKFYVDLDGARFSPDPPPSGWEEPAGTGGANRSFSVTGAPLTLPADHFSDYLPGNVIPAGVSVETIFSVDMNGVPGFIPGTHKVFAYLGQDALWAYTQGIAPGAPFEMSDENSDGIFVVSFLVTGPTLSGLQYVYGFGTDPDNPDGVEQGSGLASAGRKRLSWIPQSNTPGQASKSAGAQGGYPARYELPQATYQPTGALPVEANPLQILAIDDQVAGPEDTALSVDVLANDVDPLGSGLTVTALGSPQSGTATLSGNGRVTYTPTPDYSGPDSFTYTMTDGSGQSSSATVHVSVSPVNDPPNAAPDQVTTNKGQSVTIDALANDTDPEGDSLTLVSVTAPAKGTARIVSGKIEYAPDIGQFGTDTFEYVISDAGATARGAVIVSIANVNVAPVAVDDATTTPEDMAVTVDVLANDSDPDGDPVQVAAVGVPGSGTAELGADGVITYTPSPDFSGSDSFTYTVSDPDGLEDVGTVTVTVQGANDPPVAVDDVRTAFEGISADYDVLANDSDPDGDDFFLQSVSSPMNGTAAVVGGRIRYTPGGATMANDTFTYQIVDANGSTASASVSVSIQALPADDDGVDVSVEAAAPNGGDGNGDGIPDGEQANVASLPAGSGSGYVTVATEPGSEVVAVTATAAAPSPENDPPPAEANFPAGFLDFKLKGGTGNASRTVTITAESAFNTYYKYGPTPDNPAPHWYQFLYDGETGAVLNGNTITLHFVDGKRGDDDLTVNGEIKDPGAPALVPNQVPVAGPDRATTEEDIAVTINLLENDSDGDGDPLSVLSHTAPSHGSVRRTGGIVVYSPAAEYSGSDSFSYVLSDGRGGTVTGRVEITVTDVNDLPVAVADSFVMKEDAVLEITTLLANDTDAEGGQLALGLVFAAQEGLVSRNASGVVVYRPPADYFGADRFSYTVSDGAGESEPGVVSITITSVNDAPVAGPDFVTLEQGQASATLNLLANDSDVDSATLKVSALGTPSHGTVALVEDGSVTYTVGSTFTTTDSFSYTVSDGDGGSAQGTVSVALGAVAPDARDDAAETDEDLPVVISVTANDSDVNGDVLQVVSVTDPEHGTAAIDDDGNVVYQPYADFHGVDSFTYHVSDGGLISIGTVSITIRPVNDAPAFAEGQPVFVTPGDGTSVEIGSADIENPALRLATVDIEFAAAVDVEEAELAYTWEMSLTEGFSDVLLTQDVAGTSFTVRVADIAALISLGPGETLQVYHRVKASDGDLITASSVESITLVRGYITGVDQETLPTEFDLGQNYPNPFNPRTRIKYAVPTAGRVSILLFDALGRQVKVLQDGDMAPGYYEADLDLSAMPSGVYLYAMRAEGFVQTRSLVLLR